MLYLLFAGMGAMAAVAALEIIASVRAGAWTREPSEKVDLPVATIIVRADRDAVADISRALQRGDTRWN